MKFKYLTPSLALAFLALASCSTTKKDKEMNESIGLTQGLSKESVQQHITSWPEASKNAASDMMEKYGLPSEVGDTSLVWHDTTPFKKSVVYREEVQHQFPRPHTDILEQTVEYKVPADRVDDIWQFDGSIILDRTKGLMSARCDSEEMNLLALNLADKIAKGEMTSEEARREYTSASQSFLAGNRTPYTSAIRFVINEDAADPDSTMQAQEEITE